MKTNAPVYVVGHKNPDSDSVCSAYCYAYLKNQIDPERKYIPWAAGTLNSQTKYIFQRAQVSPPQLLRDVYPKVGDVMADDVVTVEENAPLLNVLEQSEKLKISILPAVAEKTNQEVRGIVSYLEVMDFFLRGSASERPVYQFLPQNFSRSIRGEVVMQGNRQEFSCTILTGAMDYSSFIERFQSLEAEQVVLVIGKRLDILQEAVKYPLPAIILTGMKKKDLEDLDFSSFRGWVFLSEMDTAETIRRLILSVPVKSVMRTNFEKATKEKYLDAAAEILIHTDYKALPVLHDGQIAGILTRSDLIKSVKRELILMDHNELGQAVDGTEGSSIVEIIDHHRLGTIKTNQPIHFYAKPMGSTCSLVYELFQMHQIPIPAEIAELLLAGILSDTVILKSPTCTPKDRWIVEQLAGQLRIDYTQFGMDIFAASENLKTREPASIVGTDLKIYDEAGIRVGIAQVETVTLREIDEIEKELQSAMQLKMNIDRIDWFLLLITDIILAESIMLSSDFTTGESLLPYHALSPHKYHLPGVLSRKKQLLPEILSLLETLNDKSMSNKH